jgi:riboflavin synthase
MGEIRRVDQRGDRLITIAMGQPFAAAIGDSIACNGVCLTVVKLNGQEFKVSLSAETLACTTAEQWAVGDRVNLEPALAVGDRLGGHFVSGHVDGLGKALSATASGDSTVWEFEAPDALAKFIAAKGSITVDGVSLTVNRVEGNRFFVNIIPHTSAVTGFSSLKVGNAVNLEIDMLARYVARLQEYA